MAHALQLLPKDPRNPDSYSVIPVHVWTHNVTDVVTAVQYLGSNGFDVVTPGLLSQWKMTREREREKQTDVKRRESTSFSSPLVFLSF